MESMCVEQIERSHLLSLPRLLNNRMLELRQQFLANRPRRNRDEVMNLTQNLFGKGDAKENLSFAQEELQKAPQAFCQRWNFDVDAGKPKEGPYQWELIHETTQQALDTSGRLTCLTAFSSVSNAKSSSPKSSATSTNVFPSSSSSSSSSTTTRRAITTTTFSTTTTPTAVISKNRIKRLQKSVPSKVPKLITDYFKDSKSTPVKNKSKEVTEDKDSVSNRVVEILKIRSMNVR